MRRNHWISICLALIVAALTVFLEHERARFFLTPRLNVTAQHTPPPAGGFLYKLALFMQRAEWSASDLRFKIRGVRTPNPDVVIIAIDEKSLQELHQWPWPRSIHAELIRRLSAAPPKALLFDVLFLDPFTVDPAGDKALVQATRQNPWVVHSLFLEVQGRDITGGRVPFQALSAVAQRVGSVNAFVDEDGVLRSAPLQISIDHQGVPLLSSVGAELYLNQTIEGLERRVPLDSRGEMLVRYAGGDHTFPYVSYADVLNGKVDPSRFAGKVVLVGSNATGTYDHYPSPFSATMPGVEFHANIIDNILSNHPLRYGGMRWTYAWIVVFALFCGLLLARFSAWLGALLTLVLALAYGTLAQAMFAERGILVDAAGPLATLAAGYVLVIVYHFFSEEREKRWVKAAFGQYVSPKVLDIIMADPGKLNLVGERREMTVFFSDVAGFTSISERMNPDELVVLLNRYLSAMTEVVFQNDGYLNKYMGDGIMAFWNGLLRQPNHAEMTCRCALASKARLAQLNAELEAQGMIPLNARIGINTGTMVVGNMGSKQHSDYTVMGDNVNLGSRLEGANKAFGTAIMISEFTYEIVQDQFEVRFLDRIRVPGKAKPVKTYELLGAKGEVDGVWHQVIPIYHEAIQFFADRQFERARDKFLAVTKILGHDKPSEVYLERIEQFLRMPPSKEWDGIFELKTK